MTLDEIIRAFKLTPHPEGGFYRESYRASGRILKTSDGRPARSFSTCIYYLLPPGAQSKFHRLASDEIFHFYLGDPVTWILLKDGGVEQKVLGPSLSQGHQVQLVIEAGTWFGGFLNPGGAYALMGTTVAPGFDFADFELGSKEKLSAEFPKAKDWIEKLT
jgi:predicted cupin superfamily sugar epimerase